MIDDAGKQRLTLSFYAYANSDPTQFRNDLFRAWDPSGSGRIYVAKEGINASYLFLQIILCF
jgi:UPF0176 protein